MVAAGSDSLIAVCFREPMKFKVSIDFVTRRVEESFFRLSFLRDQQVASV